MASSAFAYAFLGTNVGDVAVTKGAIFLARRCGMRGGGRFIAPKLNRRARETWALDIHTTFPNFDLHEWDLKSLSRPGIPSDGDVDQISDPALLTQLGVQDAEILFYTGGEHLFSYADRDGQDWELLVRLAPLLAAYRAGKKVVILPATFGPFDTPFSRRLASRVAESSDALVVRDLKSQQIINAITGTNPPYGLDPAFFLDAGTAGKPPDTPTANLIMRLDRFGLRAGATASKERAKELELSGYHSAHSYQVHRAIAADLLSAGVRVRVIIQCLADDAPSQALFADLNKQFPGRLELKKPISPESFISELGKAHITISSRFHGAIFSLLASRQAIALYFNEHGHKMPGLFDALDMSEFCFNASNVDPQAVIVRCHRAIKEHEGRNVQIDTLLETQRDLTVSRFLGHIPTT